MTVVRDNYLCKGPKLKLGWVLVQSDWCPHKKREFENTKGSHRLKTIFQNKELAFKLVKELLQLNFLKKEKNLIKNGRKFGTDISQKKIYRWPIAHEKMLSITSPQRSAN